MKKMSGCIVLFLLCTLPFYGQQIKGIPATVNGQFNTNISPPTYSVTIAISMESGTGTAGVLSLEFTYNNSDLTFASSPAKSTDYILYGDFDSYTTQNITRPAANSVRVSLVTTGTPAPVPLSTSPTNVITLYFTITNQAGSSNLVWVTTDVAPEFLQPNYVAGTWPNKNDTQLPVELSSFTGKVIEETRVELDWETKTEVNNYGFEIERKANNTESWGKIGFISGNGNSNSPKYYSYTDKDISRSGIYSYRLKQIDNDGSYEYSDVINVKVSLPEHYYLSQNYPNPFNPETKIDFTIPEKQFVSLKVYNTLGELVKELVNEEREAGSYSVTFDGTNLPSGIYIYRLVTQNFVLIKKMTLIK